MPPCRRPEDGDFPLVPIIIFSPVFIYLHILIHPKHNPYTFRSQPSIRTAWPIEQTLDIFTSISSSNYSPSSPTHLLSSLHLTTTSSAAVPSPPSSSTTTVSSSPISLTSARITQKPPSPLMLTPLSNPSHTPLFTNRLGFSPPPPLTSSTSATRAHISSASIFTPSPSAATILPLLISTSWHLASFC